MKTLLAIAGCGPRLEVALTSPNLAAPALAALSGPTPRSDLIVAAIDLLLRAAGIDAGGLDAVVATRGPGSFTGIRVALATAQGMAIARGISGHGVSSLLVQAARTAQRPCLAVQPARRGFVYSQLFEIAGSAETAAGGPEILAFDALGEKRVPVVAPAGLELPADVVTAVAFQTAAEALIEIARGLDAWDLTTLSPTYFENPQAVAPGPPAPSWQHSRKAS